VGLLGGVIVAVALVGIGAVAWNWSQPARDDEKVASADVEFAEGDDSPQAEGNPAIAENNQNNDAQPGDASAANATPSATQRGSEPGGGKLPAKTIAAAQKIIASQGKPIDLLRHKEIKINNVSMSVNSVWLASDLTGTRVEPKLKSSAADPAPASTRPLTESAAGEATGKYVFVEVRIANAAPVPRKYSSWNVAEATAAVLAGESGEILSPVPVSATPGVNRLKTVQVQPGQSVFDVLVFEAPPQPFESLKLALSKTAVEKSAKGHWAFDVPLEALFRKRPALAGLPATDEGALGGGPVSANQAPQATDDPVLTPPAAAAEDKPSEPPAPEKPKTNRPPTKEELNKQFVEFDKSPPADAGKEPAKAPAKPGDAKPEPAKSEPAKSGTNPSAKS
jgi:hypothetical protein